MTKFWLWVAIIFLSLTCLSQWATISLLKDTVRLKEEVIVEQRNMIEETERGVRISVQNLWHCVERHREAADYWYKEYEKLRVRLGIQDMARR